MTRFFFHCGFLIGSAAAGCMAAQLICRAWRESNEQSLSLFFFGVLLIGFFFFLLGLWSDMPASIGRAEPQIPPTIDEQIDAIDTSYRAK